MWDERNEEWKRTFLAENDSLSFVCSEGGFDDFLPRSTVECLFLLFIG